ncbi:MAG: serine/threonine-protein kinase [Myxococcota bacterium]
MVEPPTNRQPEQPHRHRSVVERLLGLVERLRGPGSSGAPPSPAGGAPLQWASKGDTLESSAGDGIRGAIRSENRAQTPPVTGDEPDDEETGELPTEIVVERSAEQDTTDQLPPGAHVGRYVTVDRIGAGGMGVVYRAYDPELNRRVALKLLRDGKDEPGGVHRSRLLREAQALARLSHPNVVGVYDVGLFGDAVYLAMEFVEGQTLRAWLEQRERTTSEVLHVLIDAGEGLAAAHDKGIVHRDFKPDNVMVDDEGRVRVVDFGLAREPHSQDTETRIDVGDPSVDTFAALTRDGAILGTPGYMAPEQLKGGSIDARTDVFSFCVTLWQGLYGTRPFGGDTPASRLLATMEGSIVEPPSNARVAPWLRRACERGLALDPAQRYADMESLLGLLRRGSSRARRMKTLVAVGFVAIAGAAVLGVQWLDRTRTAAACDSDGASIEEVWDSQRSATLRDSFLEGGQANAEEAADKALPWLDTYADNWAQVRTGVCRSANVDETLDSETYALAVSCLDEQRMGLDALATALGRGDAGAVQRAVSAASGLPSPHKCGDADRLGRLPPPPSGKTSQIEEVRRQLAHASALRRVGAYQDGLEVAKPALASAESIGWTPLVAQSRAVVGGLINANGDYAEAEIALEQTYFEAVKVGALELAADTAEILVITVGIRQRRHADAERWSQHAEAVRAMMPDLGGPRRIDGLRNRGSVRWAAGDLQEARALFERALVMREKELGANDPEFAITMGDMAMVLTDLGEYEESRALLERAIPILEEALGSRHPKVAGNLINLAGVHIRTGDMEGARDLLNRAIRTQEEVLGPEHPDLAASLHNLGIVYSELPDLPKAQASLERALEIRKKKLGAKHVAVGATMGSLAMVRYHLEDYAGAQALHERELKIREAALGPDHPSLAYPLVGAAEAAIVQEHFAEALPLAERAVALRRGGKASPGGLGLACFILAKALWGSGGDRARAQSLADEARTGFEKENMEEFLRQLDDWEKSRK